jgi:hypothetical protein
VIQRVKIKKKLEGRSAAYSDINAIAKKNSKLENE